MDYNEFIQYEQMFKKIVEVMFENQTELVWHPIEDILSKARDTINNKDREIEQDQCLIYNTENWTEIEFVFIKWWLTDWTIRRTFLFHQEIDWIFSFKEEDSINTIEEIKFEIDFNWSDDDGED